MKIPVWSGCGRTIGLAVLASMATVSAGGYEDPSAGLSVHSSTGKQTLRICTDNNYWYPFTFLNGVEVAGLHVDIVRHALSKTGVRAMFTALPWKRCLMMAGAGDFDAVVSASWQPERTILFHYPEGAEGGGIARERIMQVDYVVVTTAENEYEFDGDIRSLPEPVRATLGYSVVADLEAAGLNVEATTRGDETNLLKMLRTGDGAVITLASLVINLGDDPAMKGRLKIHEPPLLRRTYYMPFSRKGWPDQALRERIWDAIRAVREDENLFQTLSDRYRARSEKSSQDSGHTASPRGGEMAVSGR